VARRKTSKSGSADDEGPTYLSKPFTEVAAFLDDQIARGRELLAPINPMVYPEPGHVDGLRVQYRGWHNYTATYLERAFTTKELHDRFEGVFFGVVGGRETDLDRLRELAQDLQRDINHLADLRQRLSLYEPPKPQNAPSTLAGRVPINVTIQGGVGQVNFAELIERIDARIQQVDRRGEAGLADALEQLGEAIKAASEAAEDQREEALDAVAVLAEVGSLPPEERGKLKGRVRGAFFVIKELVQIAPSVKKAWDAWGPTMMEHLPHLPS